MVGRQDIGSSTNDWADSIVKLLCLRIIGDSLGKDWALCSISCCAWNLWMLLELLAVMICGCQCDWAGLTWLLKVKVRMGWWKYRVGSSVDTTLV